VTENCNGCTEGLPLAKCCTRDHAHAHRNEGVGSGHCGHCCANDFICCGGGEEPGEEPDYFAGTPLQVTPTSNTILVWRFHDAPEHLQGFVVFIGSHA